jgi:hypothetical protein
MERPARRGSVPPPAPSPPPVVRRAAAGLSPLAGPVRPIVLLGPARLGSPPKLGLEVGDRIRQHGGMAPTQEREPKRPVHGRQVARPETPGLPLTQPHSGHRQAARHLIVERRRISAHADHAR